MKRVVCLLAICTMLIAGCGVDWFPAADPNAPTSVTVSTSSSSPVVGGSATITATVKKADGTAVADGTVVSFTITTGA
ncbi:MAG TPA: hypothetical protein VEM32_01780, partial [Geobacteraceae bacterium]|nr:hypothetical protein [Geobacteraceae bacterium]